MAYCINCGSEIGSGDKRCPGCNIRVFPKRPVLITVVCVLLGMAAVGLIFATLIYAGNDGLAHKVLNVSIAGVWIVAVVGLWRMRRWGAVVYVVESVINYIHLIAIGHFMWSGFLFDIAMISICAMYYRRML
jgi:energy-converting hydrogenase Eha subunit B